MTCHIPGDCIVFPASPGSWLVYNIRTRTALGFDDAALVAWSACVSEGTPDTNNFGGTVWRAHRFTQTDCTLHDPSRLIRNRESWGEGNLLHGTAFRSMLLRHHLLFEETSAYERLFERPQHPLDRARLGNFHDQLGRHLLFDRRDDPSAWWISQKFLKTGAIRQDNAYGTVQWPALCRAFDQYIQPGMKVLDFGCGTGTYAVEMAKRGASVIGLDPSPAYLEIAAEQAKDFDCHFKLFDPEHPESIPEVTSENFDAVFISDALLFYFIPISTRTNPEPDILIKSINNILKPNGMFISMEPHSAFYLAPWLGDENHPWTIISEYRHRRYSTVPQPSSTMKKILNNGFVLTGFEDIYRDRAHESGDIRADIFADEFPLWTLRIFNKLSVNNAC